MRTISLSSRLQWAFRGTVLPGALATGDVDNDGCKEFVVGSVQGELAIFRGRGGCGSWRYSEDQIEPEYDCWDAIDRGEIPADYHLAPPAAANSDLPPASMRRQSTYNSLVQGLSSNHESLSVSDILHMFGGDLASASQTGSGNSSEDEAADELRRREEASSANQWDFPESTTASAAAVAGTTGHIRWEDALDIERDGRKPWIVAQKLGTISSVVVADICNCGHNSIVVVNGEGKCHIFDYPFKRRFHPDLAKRRRQNNHYRRFSQDRFFKDGVVTDVRDLPEDRPASSHRHSAHASSSQHADLSCGFGQPPSRDPAHSVTDAGAGAAVPSVDLKQSNNSPHTKFAVFAEPPDSSATLSNTRRRGHSNSVSTPAIHKHESAAVSETSHTLGGGPPANALALPRMTASTAQLASAPGYADVSRSYASGPNSHAYMSSTARRSVSGVGGHPVESDGHENAVGAAAQLASGSDAALASNLSSQRDPPLTILDKCDSSREHLRESAYRGGGARRASDAGRFPVSPAAMRGTGTGQGGFSAGTGSSSGHGHRGGHHHHHPNASDAGGGGGDSSLSAAYGDADIDSDFDNGEEALLSDNGDIPLLSREEAADIENIWGANLGKKSGDWFPFVLDRPDMTFAIPTNVEHAIVADIDNNGLNELVLTATDGFVYIFRIESTVKHAVKPTLSSLGVFSTIPTALPSSVNMTTGNNGSPYLHMSAPRSPDASDLELSDFQRTSRPSFGNGGGSRVDGKRAPLGGGGGGATTLSGKSPRRTTTATATSAPGSAVLPGAESDLDLVNHLLKSIKEVSSTTPAERRTTESAGGGVFVGGGGGEVRAFPHLVTVSEPDTQQQPTLDAQASDSCQDDSPQVRVHPPRASAAFAAAPNSASSPTSGRRRSSGNRMSLSSRMRESFGGGVVSGGWDAASRRPASSYNQTAPPSISHSRAATANNSGHSTMTHSRLPSTGDEANELVVGPGSNVGVGTDLSPHPNTYPEQTSCTGEGTRKTRARQNSVCIGALGILQEMPERRSGDMEGNEPHLRDIDETCSFNAPAATSQLTTAPSPPPPPPAIVATQPEPSQLDRPAIRAGGGGGGSGGGGGDGGGGGGGNSGDAPPLVDPFMLQRLIAGSGGSRGSHSRSGSLAKPVSSSSRVHSRRGSVSSAVATKQQAPSVNSLSVDYASASEQQQQQRGQQPGGSVAAADSRRESLGSNVSALEGSVYNANAGNVAEPLEVAVSARGSFSKPDYPQPARNADTDDDDSIASQVTERLAKLGFSAGGRSALHADHRLAAAEMLPPMDGNRQLAHVLAPLEREIVSMLPPPRSIVDWSATSADKVATWFLDNIPGNVSIVNAPASAFGTPLAQQRKALESESSSECDCSSCDCSLYTSDSEGSSSSELAAADIPYVPLSNARSAVGGQTIPAPLASAVGPSLADGVSGATAGYSGINLPQPLGLCTIVKEPEEACVAESAEVDSGAGNKQPATSGDGPGDTQHSQHQEKEEKEAGGGGGDGGHKLHLGSLPELGQVSAAEKVQQYLILSKPGGRFVPIDMVHGTMLPTVEPPPIPMASMTGGNNAHMMNVDVSRSMHSLHLTAPMVGGTSYQQYSGIGYTAMSSSYMYQSPSWQSGSMAWSQHIPGGATYNSTGAMAKSPVVMPGPVPSRSQPSRMLPADTASPRSVGQSTEVLSVSQFPSSESLHHVAANFAPRAHVEPSSALQTASSRKSFVSNGSASVFNSGTMGGPTSLSSNLRTKRSMQWGQHFNPGQGPSPIYRGKYSSGAMTPELGGGGGGGMGLGVGGHQHGRQNLGFAGLRGYIGHGPSRQRTSGGSTTNRHGDDRGPLTGYFTPSTSGQLSAHGLSAAGLGQGSSSGVGSSGIMPREPIAMQSSSIATVPSVPNAAAERAGGARRESVRKLISGHRSSPSAAIAEVAPSAPLPLPPLASASPQRGQPTLRYSPSMAAWSSFKEGSVLSTIKDQDDAHENAELSRGPSRRNSATAVAGGRFLSEPLPNVHSLTTGPTAVLHPAREMMTPFSDEPAGRSYWMGTEPPSARSHSSLGTGASIGHGPVEEEKEEEIEEAPQPMELDVATYMVGGVAAGKRMRRILSGPTDRARIVRDTNDGDDYGSDSECEFELNELVSLVTMDGVICVFDPVRKVNHFVGLLSKDPVLGIWKVKMHEEVCNPSPLETMLQDGNINVNQEFGIQLLSSTPAKRIYRRIGLSHRDLLYAAHYSVYIEDRVMMVNQLENHRRWVARRRMKKLRSQTRLNYELPGDRAAMRGAARRIELSPGASRNNTLSKVSKYGLNGARLRENLKYQRVGRAVRNFGTHVRDLAASGSTQPSAGAESSTAGPYITPSALTDDDHLDVQPSEFTTPGMSFSPAVRRLSATPRVPNPAQQSEQGHYPAGGRGTRVLCSEDGTGDEAACNMSTDANASAYGVASFAERSTKGNNKGSNNMPTSPFLSARTDAKLASKSLGTDIAAALTGWYGENRDDYRRALRVCDHLVVSTWRGTTYFVDVGTMLDIAHYNELFHHHWSVRQAAVIEAAGAAAAASVSERDGSSNFDAQSITHSTLYGNLSEFYDVTGLLSRLRANGSVIQFKFQDTVSAFLADTYAPATGGPNVPCIFYVDYKDRIWAYYHLDEIAEMDDVYGATWFRDEPESLHTPASKARAIMSGIDTTSYDKPFSVADLAHRRMNMEPWMPLPSETAFSSLVSFSEPNYPYSTRTWRKRRTDSSTNTAEHHHHGGSSSGAADGCNYNSVPRAAAAASSSLDEDRAYNFGGGRTFDSSDNSTPPCMLQRNANTSGRYHDSYLPGPYLCPIWADINSVDLYDVGVCNFIELATPELLVFKDIFCKDLGIDSSTINEKVNLASIPGLANWVRSCLFMA